ncbi:MAG: hypothetical protein IPM37_08250 [Hahellaceae bacterium]|nr:hypothetical protein [Hahellaceae bacterium]
MNHFVELEADSWIPDPLAVPSIREGLAKGDPRVPPIKRAEPDERPDARELAMPDAYLGYESRQEQKLKAAFVVAVDLDVPALETAIQEARGLGLPPEQLREGEEKLRRMRQMQAQLLSDDAALQTLVDPAARE